MNNEVSKLVNVPFAQILGDEKLNANLLYLANKYFNLPATNCETSRHYYYEKLKTIKNKPMAQKKNYLDKKYILRGSALLYYNNTHFNNDTLTDRIAESAIKKFPDLKGLFLNDKERKVLEVLNEGVKHVQEAEEDLHNDPILKEITALVKDEQYEEAKEKAKTLDGDQVVKDSLSSIDKAEEKAVEDAIKKEEAKKKADEVKAKKAEAEAKKAKEEAEAKKKADEVKAKKAEAEAKKAKEEADKK